MTGCEHEHPSFALVTPIDPAMSGLTWPDALTDAENDWYKSLHVPILNSTDKPIVIHGGAPVSKLTRADPFTCDLDIVASSDSNWSSTRTQVQEKRNKLSAGFLLSDAFLNSWTEREEPRQADVMGEDTENRTFQVGLF